MNILEYMNLDPNEKPLDNIVSDGGFCSILRSIGCVGDSLSSGEFEGTNAEGGKSYHDMFDYSWGQFMARMAGITVHNFSKGGMTAKAYMESFAESKGFWNPELACNAYIIALGVNDLNDRSTLPVGSVADICAEDYKKNSPTFTGYYAQIVQRLKEIQPDAKFFFMTIPSSNKNSVHVKHDDHSRALYEMADYFDNAYVLDFRKYAPVYDGEFRKRFFLGGHMAPTGYYLTAKMVVSYIDYIIRHNYQDFKQVGFIGTPYKNTVEKGFKIK